MLGSAFPKAPDALADVSVVDVTDGPPQLLYTHRFGAANSSNASSRYVVDVHFGGRHWQVVSHAHQGFDKEGNWQAVFCVGGVISVLLAALVWSLASTRERAIQLGTALGRRFLASEERFRTLNEVLPCLVLLVRKRDGKIVYRNAAARTYLASDDDAGLSGLLPSGQQHELPLLASTAMGPAAASHSAARDVQLQAQDGKAFWASLWTSSVELEGESMWLLVASDTSEQRRLTERLSHQASHDSLTRLYNRREFERQVQARLAMPGEDEGAILFLDLDQFKLINDTSGHRAGDELLVQLAIVMQEHLRPEDVLARLGGDEFGVLLPGLVEPAPAMQAAERLRRSIEAFMFAWEGRSYTISASIGVVMLRSAAGLKELFAHADAACYLAKEAGRNRTHAYVEDDAAITRRMSEMEWANRVRDALRDGRLLLDYQELHRLQPGHAGTQVELLLRLRGEDGSEVQPGAFLPAAERYGLMPLIDHWVVDTALSNLDHLHPAGKALTSCSINLSAASLEDEALIARIEQLLRFHQINPQRITFEITETVAMRDFSASSALLARLRGLGCKVALDDFGAGMSSFGYLKNLALDVVKIDGSFVQNMLDDPMSQAIVRAVTEIGHLQGLEVVAEWVSSPQLSALLATMQVDYVQGFALHRPERVCFQRAQ
jgi:diguanylate cyclase (GGDEF)-like protein